MDKDFMYAKYQVIRCIKDLRQYEKYKDDSLIKLLIQHAKLELNFFFKHRHDLSKQKMNRNFKYIID